MEAVKVPGSDQTMAEAIVAKVRHMKTLEGMVDNEENRTFLELSEKEINDMLSELSEDERRQVIEDIEQLGQEHDETVKRLKEQKRIAAKQLKAAINGENVKCFCEKVTSPPWKLYKCYYCGIFFCERCAAEHFGETREEHNERNYKAYMVPR